MDQEITKETIQESFKEIQNEICQFLVKATNQPYTQDLWNYEKGEGGGITRVWEGKEGEPLEKAGVNFSGIGGSELPGSATTQLNLKGNEPFFATGVSLVIHPLNPHIPTIHMNVRYFECGEKWWFGGGVDLTPYYPTVDQVVLFHQTLKKLCEKWEHDYYKYKENCDQYFFLKHRNEARGIGGLFFDHLNNEIGKSKKEIFLFVEDLGKKFVELYKPFITPQQQEMKYSEEERQFQLIRRSRYVEFNLIYDRGTKFGLQSNGRTESILMSLPSVAHWKYNWKPREGTKESLLISFFLQPRDWASYSPSDSNTTNMTTTTATTSSKSQSHLFSHSPGIPVSWLGIAVSCLAIGLLLSKWKS